MTFSSASSTKVFTLIEHIACAGSFGVRNFLTSGHSQQAISFQSGLTALAIHSALTFSRNPTCEFHFRSAAIIVSVSVHAAWLIRAASI
jgi:hypothetical protein